MPDKRGEGVVIDRELEKILKFNTRGDRNLRNGFKWL